MSTEVYYVHTCTRCGSNDRTLGKSLPRGWGHLRHWVNASPRDLDLCPCCYDRFLSLFEQPEGE